MKTVKIVMAMAMSCITPILFGSEASLVQVSTHMQEHFDGPLEQVLLKEGYLQNHASMGMTFWGMNKSMVDALDLLSTAFHLTNLLKVDSEKGELLALDLCHWVLHNNALIKTTADNHKKGYKEKLKELFQADHNVQQVLRVNDDNGSDKYPDLAAYCTLAPEIVKFFQFLQGIKNFKQTGFVLGTNCSKTTLAVFKKLLYFLYNAHRLHGITFEQVNADNLRNTEFTLKGIVTYCNQHVDHTEVAEVLEMAHKWGLKSVVHALVAVLKKSVEDETEIQDKRELLESIAQNIPLYYFPCLGRCKDNVSFVTELLNLKITSLVAKNEHQDKANHAILEECYKVLADCIEHIELESIKLNPYFEEEFKSMLIRCSSCVSAEVPHLSLAAFDMLLDSCNMGERCYQQGYYERAFVHFTHRAQLNTPYLESNPFGLCWARVRLGELLIKGKGCTQDVNRGLLLLKGAESATTYGCRAKQLASFTLGEYYRAYGEYGVATVYFNAAASDGEDILVETLARLHLAQMFYLSGFSDRAYDHLMFVIDQDANKDAQAKAKVLHAKLLSEKALDILEALRSRLKNTDILPAHRIRVLEEQIWSLEKYVVEHPELAAGRFSHREGAGSWSVGGGGNDHVGLYPL